MIPTITAADLVRQASAMARFLGNTNTKEAHDTHNKQTNCQLNEIKNSKTFSPDTFAQAKSEGYDGCRWCLPGKHTG